MCDRRPGRGCYRDDPTHNYIGDVLASSNQVCFLFKQDATSPLEHADTHSQIHTRTHSCSRHPHTDTQRSLVCLPIHRVCQQLQVFQRLIFGSGSGRHSVNSQQRGEFRFCCRGVEIMPSCCSPASSSSSSWLSVYEATSPHYYDGPLLGEHQNNNNLRQNK